MSGPRFDYDFQFRLQSALQFSTNANVSIEKEQLDFEEFMAYDVDPISATLTFKKGPTYAKIAHDTIANEFLKLNEQKRQSVEDYVELNELKDKGKVVVTLKNKAIWDLRDFFEKQNPFAQPLQQKKSAPASTPILTVGNPDSQKEQKETERERAAERARQEAQEKEAQAAKENAQRERARVAEAEAQRTKKRKEAEAERIEREQREAQAQREKETQTQGQDTRISSTVELVRQQPSQGDAVARNYIPFTGRQLANILKTYKSTSPLRFFKNHESNEKKALQTLATRKPGELNDNDIEKALGKRSRCCAFIFGQPHRVKLFQGSDHQNGSGTDEIVNKIRNAMGLRPV